MLEEFDSKLYNPIIITFDGTSASGKGTIVKGVKKCLDDRYKSLDAGAMYRALTFYFVNQEIKADDLKRGNDLQAKLRNEVKLDFSPEGIIMLNGSLLDASQIRGEKIDPFVGKFASIDEVKRYLVEQQRDIVANSNCGWILDGRCMGTAVAPQAQAKFFVDAPLLVRATRRHIDYVKMGKDWFSTEEIYIDLERRDKLDYETEIAPLKRPEDAIDIDSFKFSPEDAVEKAIKYIRRKIEENK